MCLASSVADPGLRARSPSTPLSCTAPSPCWSTPAVVESDEFMTALRTVIDPADLAGSGSPTPTPITSAPLHRLLAENPRAPGHHDVPRRRHDELVRAVADGPGLSRQPRTDDHASATAPSPPCRPPVFDNPVTTGFHDDRSGALFSSDCFGALLPSCPTGPTTSSDAELRDGQVLLGHGRLAVAAQGRPRRLRRRPGRHPRNLEPT